MVSTILLFSKLSTQVNAYNNQHQQQGGESQKRLPKRRQRTTIGSNQRTKNNNMIILTAGIILALQGLTSSSLLSLSSIEFVQAALEQPRNKNNIPNNNVRSRSRVITNDSSTHNRFRRRNLQEQDVQHQQKEREDQQQQGNGAIKMESNNNDQTVLEQQTVPFNTLNADNFVKEEIAIEQQLDNTTPPTAIIHVGPHKTGSTTIQSYIRGYITDLELNDNYILPGDWNNRPKGAINMMDLVKCFLFNNQLLGSDFETNKNDLCDTHSYNDLQMIGGDKHANLLLSAESFSYANVDIKSVYTKINQYYTDDNIRVILYYRRFYDWLISYWNQMNKVLPYNQRVTFVQYLENSNLIDTMYYTGPYFYGVTQRWEEYFTNVVKFNLYDLPEPNDSTATFLCHGLINANETCNKHKNRPPVQKKKHINESVDLVYDDLFFSAIKLLKLDFTTTLGTDDPRTSSKQKEIRSKIIYKIQEYQEKTLQLKSYDFDYKICPSNTIQQMLLERTKQTERIYFNEYYTTIGENEINKNFQEFQQTKLCTINTDAVIQNSTVWQDFFHQLEKDQFLQN